LIFEEKRGSLPASPILLAVVGGRINQVCVVDCRWSKEVEELDKACLSPSGYETYSLKRDEGE
jgi:hypothetical protein